MRRLTFHTILLTLLLLSLLAGCSSTDNSAPQAVEKYLQALVGNDTQITSYTCTAWEDQAKTEADSFAGVTADLQDLACQVSEQDSDSTLVTCTGKIITSYNGENTEIDLSGKTYQAVQEDDQWLMCGYK
jgi:hypothetical protein